MDLTLNEAREKFARERGVSADIDAANAALVAELEAKEAPAADAPTVAAEETPPAPAGKASKK